MIILRIYIPTDQFSIICHPWSCVAIASGIKRFPSNKTAVDTVYVVSYKTDRSRLVSTTVTEKRRNWRNEQMLLKQCG
jgi:hypothetical protein